MIARSVLQLGVLLFPVFFISAEQAPQTPPAPRLNIIVVEGEGAINNIKQRTSRETIVQVEDENHKPIAGAAVVFLLPGDGPGGAFVDGSRSATLVTDAQGQAALPKMQPNQLTGNFQIRVNASYQGRQGNATITQSNAAGVAASGAAHAGISGKTIGIIVGIAAAGAVGAAVGLKGGSKNQTSPAAVTVPTGTISAGAGASVGPPQ